MGLWRAELNWTYCSLPGSSVHGIHKTRPWSELPWAPPRDLPNWRIESGSPTVKADSLPSEPPILAQPDTTWKQSSVVNSAVLPVLFKTSCASPFVFIQQCSVSSAGLGAKNQRPNRANACLQVVYQPGASTASKKWRPSTAGLSSK